MARLRGQGVGHLGEALSRCSERVGKGLQFPQTTLSDWEASPGPGRRLLQGWGVGDTLGD